VIPDDRHLLVRAGALYIAALAVLAVWIWRRPAGRAAAGALLATIWNLPALLVLNVAAPAEWWRFDARGGLLLDVPVDLLLSWAALWGVVPALVFPAQPLIVVVIAALLVDLALMPAAFPVLQLGPRWLAGEAVCLVAVLAPAQLLARWTTRSDHLYGRVLLQVLAFSGLLMFVLPAVAIEGSGGGWVDPRQRPAWQLGLFAQLLMLPGILGLSAVQEFATRGGGTPVPFDPPSRIVITGPYAYVRNPMQMSAIVLLVLLGIVLRNPWIAAAGAMAHVYSAGLAGWDEHDDLRRRFGEDWLTYRGAVRAWLPRLRPWHRPGEPPARLFVAETCGMCREVGEWFSNRHASHLEIVPAESHRSGALARITYEAADGSRAAAGVEAVTRALEHIHLGWAFAGWALRLPVILPLAQLLVDACGGEPRRVGLPGRQTRIGAGGGNRVPTDVLRRPAGVAESIDTPSVSGRARAAAPFRSSAAARK
jgi:protein-S-isoprenylcysteine O-methyltransferase Ste14